MVPERTRTLAFDKMPGSPSDAELLRRRCDSQSAAFYGDISSFMCEHIKEHATYSLLDVGPRTGAGLALLRLVHHPLSFSRLKFDPVLGVDLDPGFELTAFREFPDIEARTVDIFDMEPKTWDIVISSHTVEHVLEAEQFVEGLVRLACRFVILACPFSENPLGTGHVRTIDHKFLSDQGFTLAKIYESHHFHGGVCCIALRRL